jgi:hypothetical protein
MPCLKEVTLRRRKQADNKPTEDTVEENCENLFPLLKLIQAVEM